MNAMKKIYSIIFAAAALFAASSCQEEIVEPDLGTQENESMTITAGFGAETKTVLDGIKTYWTEGDQISVFDSNKKESDTDEGNNRCFSIDETATTFEDGKAASATFKYDGEFVWPQNNQPDPLVVALYPYQENAYCDFFYYDRNYITGLNIPVEQVALEGGFDANATFALATSKYSESDNLIFTNLYTLLKVTLKEEGVEKVKVEVTGGNIAGEAKVQLNLEMEDENTPVFNGGTLSATENGANTVTLTCDGGFKAVKDYYIAIAPVTYTNIKVYLDDVLVKDTTPAQPKALLPNTIYNIKDLQNPEDRGLSFPQETYNVLLGNDFTAPELSGEKDGVVYTSSNEGVATVDGATGEVTIIAEGTTVITAAAPKTATLLDGEASYTLVVGAKADRDLAFNPTSVQVAYDATSFELPELTGEADDVVYVSSDTDVATVDAATGEVTITGVGETVITASAEADETHLAGSASYTLTVTKTERTVSFAETSQTVTYGDDVELQTLISVTDADVITYSITEGEAATIENDALKLVKAGTVTITATVAETDTQNECSASYTLTVERAQRTVSFAESSKTVTYGDPVELPVLNDVDSDDDITYESSDKTVATVDQSGNITTLKDGTTTITATVAETDTHMSATATCELVVEIAEFEPEDGYIYMRPSAEWKSDNARFAAYFFNGTWQNMTLVKGQLDIYQCEIPEGETNVIFCRMNPSTTENNFNEGVKWTQTSDLTMLKGCLYTVSGWNDGAWSGEAAVDPVDAKEAVVGFSGIFGGVESWGDNDIKTAEYTTVNYTDESIFAGTYTFELTDFEVAANDKFKVRVNGAWIGSGNASVTGISLGAADNDGNFVVSGAGTYDVTVTFVWDGCDYSNVNVQFVKQGGTDPEPEPEQTYRICLHKNWNWSDIHLYGWIMNTDTSIFGTWPGKLPDETETIGSETYLYWNIPEEHVGKTVGLIIYGKDNGTVKEPRLENVVLNQDYCYKFEWTSEKGDHLIPDTK